MSAAAATTPCLDIGSPQPALPRVRCHLGFLSHRIEVAPGHALPMYSVVSLHLRRFRFQTRGECREGGAHSDFRPQSLPQSAIVAIGTYHDRVAGTVARSEHRAGP